MKSHRTSKHHIIPRSRRGSSKLENIAYVDFREHEKYHALFSNKTPVEIVQYLNSYFWDNHYYVEMRSSNVRG